MRFLTALCGAVLACVSGAALSQEFPQKGVPIEITVLFPAGSSADVTARLLADGMGKQLNTSVIVVNRPGAGGAIGYRYVASQKPDGHSLVWNSNSISTTYYSGTLAFRYDAFDAVAQALVETPVIAVKSDARWKTIKDLVADAKVRPKGITVGNSGVGSHTHISSVAMFKTAGVEVLEVPFSAAQVIPSVLGGQVDAVVQLPAALAGNVQAGQLRLLAALTANRDPAFPDVPTALESGFDVSLEAWRGIAAPKGTPKAVIAALEDSIKRTVESAEFRQACLRIGARPAFKSTADFAQVIASEDAELAKLMDMIGMKKQ